MRRRMPCRFFSKTFTVIAKEIRFTSTSSTSVCRSRKPFTRCSILTSAISVKSKNKRGQYTIFYRVTVINMLTKKSPIRVPNTLLALAREPSRSISTCTAIVAFWCRCPRSLPARHFNRCWRGRGGYESCRIKGWRLTGFGGRLSSSRTWLGRYPFYLFYFKPNHGLGTKFWTTVAQ